MAADAIAAVASIADDVAVLVAVALAVAVAAALADAVPTAAPVLLLLPTWRAVRGTRVSNQSQCHVWGKS